MTTSVQRIYKDPETDKEWSLWEHRYGSESTYGNVALGISGYDMNGDEDGAYLDYQNLTEDYEGGNIVSAIPNVTDPKSFILKWIEISTTFKLIQTVLR